MSHCPSCGRYVGPYEACPYCGARLTGRVPVRLVKLLAILLAVVGGGALWFAAIHAEVPLIRIGQAGATMNLAYVRVRGRCTRGPSYEPEDGYLSFWIEDRTGELRVASYQAETQQLVERGRVPALGDRVEVAGTIRVREDFLGLTLNAPEQLRFTRAEPAESDIGAITPEDQYRRVRVRGRVREVYAPYEGLTLISIRDKTGAIPIAVSEDLMALSGITPTVESGQSVEVVASVSLYEGMPQLVPASTADITALDHDIPVAAERFIGELSASDVGQWFAVRGTVTGLDSFSEGVKLIVDDGTGEITVLLWQDVYDALRNGPAPAVGAEVRARGELSRYRGELELIPKLPGDAQVLAAPTAIPIGEMGAEDVGRPVTLIGTLGEPEKFSAGVKFPLSDETGTITLLLWQDTYDALPDADKLVAGARVRVKGRIDEYRGDLEIVPEADGVQVTR